MKILLINLYPTDTISRYLLSSYLLKGYISKHFKDINVVVANYSANYSNEKIIERILIEKPTCVGYSCYCWNFDKINEIAAIIKNESIIQIFGGPEISYEKISLLKNNIFADYCVVGEGEKKLLNLLHFILGEINDLPNGIISLKNLELQYNKCEDCIEDLDEIPSVYLNNILDDNLYVKQQAFLETQRGCCFKCKYCVYHKGLSRVTTYSLDRIFFELNYLILEKKVKALRICDSIFALDLNRAKNITRHLIDLKKRCDSFPLIYWELMYFSMDEEFAHLISKLRSEEKIENCKNIKTHNFSQMYSEMLNGYNVINCVGLQSFSNDALVISGRPPIKKEKIKKLMSLCKKNNIVLKTDIILGLPMETFESYRDGLNYFLPFFNETDHLLNIHRLRILPGSEFETLYNELNISSEKNGIVLSTNTMTKFEIEYLSMLSALVFRTINSPLRIDFFKAIGVFEKPIDVFDRMLLFAQKHNLFKNNMVDDVYWNNKVFKDITSIWIKNFLYGGLL